MRSLLAGCFVSLAMSTAVCAEPIGMVTGSESGTYIKIGNDIASVAAREGVEIEVKSSAGTLANVERMNSSENAGIGILQSDVLSVLLEKTPKALEGLRMAMPLYDEEVQLFAASQILSIRDLSGKRVVVGPVSSGVEITALNLLTQFRVHPAQVINEAPATGVQMVLDGEADAVFYVAGKPVEVFTRIGELPKSQIKGYHFVPLAIHDIEGEYVPATLSSKDYGWMDREVRTISTKAVLAVYDFSSERNGYYRARCADYEKIGKAIYQNLADLQQNGHPKWKQVDLHADIGSWTRDACFNRGIPQEVAAVGSVEAGDEVMSEDKAACTELRRALGVCK